MADVADIAADIEAQRLRIILSNRKTFQNRASATHCEECDKEIPELRRTTLPGVSTCVDCQSIIELKQRLH